jgi:hypothetical protein
MVQFFSWEHPAKRFLKVAVELVGVKQMKICCRRLHLVCCRTGSPQQPPV